MKGRGAFVFFAFVTLITLGLFGLGLWQWQRLHEKRSFIAAVEAGAQQAPRAVEGAKLWDRVRITGRYLPEHAVPILFSRPQPAFGARDQNGKVPQSGFGALLMVPFSYTPCPACAEKLIFINRGFLPTPPNGQVPPVLTPAGMVSVTGFLRPSEAKGLFQPASNIEKRVFFRRDLVELAMAAALPAIETGFFLDREAEAGESTAPYGVAVQDFIKAIPNNHFEYALTWWALAFTNIIVALAFWRSRRQDV